MLYYYVIFSMLIIFRNRFLFYFSGFFILTIISRFIKDVNLCFNSPQQRLIFFVRI